MSDTNTQNDATMNGATDEQKAADDKIRKLENRIEAQRRELNEITKQRSQDDIRLRVYRRLQGEKLPQGVTGDFIARNIIADLETNHRVIQDTSGEPLVDGVYDFGEYFTRWSNQNRFMFTGEGSAVSEGGDQAGADLPDNYLSDSVWHTLTDEQKTAAISLEQSRGRVPPSNRNQLLIGKRRR